MLLKAVFTFSTAYKKGNSYKLSVKMQLLSRKMHEQQTCKHWRIIDLEQNKCILGLTYKIIINTRADKSV